MKTDAHTIYKTIHALAKERKSTPSKPVMPTGQILQPGSARTARRDRIYLGNLFATPHTRSTLPHSVFCLRLSCPLVPNPAGKQAALKKIKMRKESDAGHLFLNFLLFNICQVGYFPAPFQNGPRDSII